jgi:hypothetical protein
MNGIQNTASAFAARLINGWACLDDLTTGLSNYPTN